MLTALAMGLLWGCDGSNLQAPADDTSSTVTQVLDRRACKDVDLLMVVDDGPTSAGLQQRLGHNALGRPFDREGLEDFTLRVGVAAAGLPHAGCGLSGMNEPAGEVRLAACTTRPEAFVGSDGLPDPEVFARACLDACPVDLGDALVFDPDTPWVEFGATWDPATSGDWDPDAPGTVKVTAFDIDGDGILEDDEVHRGVCQQGAPWPCVDVHQVLACVLPQGSAGCPMQSPLEAQYQVLQSGMGSGVGSGMGSGVGSGSFLRPGAGLLVSHVTDGVDCSAPMITQGAVFHPDTATRELWEDAGTEVPTQAVCWNAGTACVGSGDSAEGYEVCGAVDRNYLGEVLAPGVAGLDPDGPDSEGVPLGEQPALFPVARYVSQLEALRAQKLAELEAGVMLGPDGTDGPDGPDGLDGRQAWTPSVWFAAAAGVPVATRGVAAPALVVRESTDPEVSAEYGIDAGCTSASANPEVVEVFATPPLRLMATAAMFREQGGSGEAGEPHEEPGEVPGGVTSSCDVDYTEVFGLRRSQSLADQIHPRCFKGCPVDVDPEAEGLQVRCTMTEAVPQGRSGAEGSPTMREIPSCAQGLIPNGAGACYEEITGAALDPVCAAEGYGLEFKLVRDPNHPVPCGTTVKVTCEATVRGPEGCGDG